MENINALLTDTDITNKLILQTTDLCHSFGKIKAVDHLNLRITEGEIYGFLGLNGAGKTTTIQMILGVLGVDFGTIELFGEVNKRTTVKQKQQIGFVSQEQNIYPWMTAEVAGKFVKGLYPNWDQEEYVRLLEVFEIPSKQKFSTFSGGMKMKLAFALAVAPRPKILILDEPTAGMDPVARREFLQIIKRQSKKSGCTVFFSSHLLDEVEFIADTVGIIHKGKMKFEGNLDLLQQRVRRVRGDQCFMVPEGFELWHKDLADASDEESFYYTLCADPEHWDSSELDGKILSLNDIFIDCVSLSTMDV